MSDVLAKLKIVVALQPGDPLPAEIGDNMAWGPSISQLCSDAAQEIIWLRAQIEFHLATIAELRLVAGPVSIDAVKFADIKKFAKNPVLGEFTDGK